MGIIVVEVCDSNWMSGFDLEDLEVLYPGVSVIRSECMSKCGMCEHNAYAYVNGKIVYAKDAEMCFKRIKERIEYEFSLMDEVQ